MGWHLWKDAGIQFIAYSVDVAILVEVSKNIISQLREN